MTPSTESHKQTKSHAIVWTKADQDRLLALPGDPGLWVGEEKQFLAETGCPPEDLEEWLEKEWIPCDLRAAVSGAEVVAPYSYLLIDLKKNPPTARLFCYPKALVLADYLAESLTQLGQTIAALPRLDAAAQITSQIDQLASACAARELSIIEVELVWGALWLSVQRLERSGSKLCDSAVRKRLQASMVRFQEVYAKRGADQTSQAKYAEAQVDARRALGVNHNPALDGFLELVELARQASSAGVACYVFEEMRGNAEQYLAAMEMMARDHADPLTVDNPPARVHAALSRKQRRSEELERRRWSPLLPDVTNRLKDALDLEADLNAALDWERAKSDLGLTDDQAQVIEAKMDGLDPHFPGREEGGRGYDSRRAESLRRSLAKDRSWGKKLRRRLSPYLRRRR